MARKQTSIGPWPKGINNSAGAHALPEGACADALNVDWSDDGRAITRTGFKNTVPMDNGHSLATISGKTIVCQGGDLGVITGLDPLVITTLRTGLGTGPISYAELGDEIWWSNGEASGRINADNTDSAWSAPKPSNIVAVAPGTGVMPAGEYRLAITHVMASGEEGPSSAIHEFTLSDTGSLVITLPAAKAGTAYFRIYATIANGQALRHYSDVVSSSSTANITATPAGMQIGSRAFLEPLPSGNPIAFHNGRLLTASGNTICLSEPYDFGLYDPLKGVITLPGSIKILAPCEGGVFVVADKTYFYAGNDLQEATVSEVLPYGGVSGTVFSHPNVKAVGWMGDNGFVLGFPDGSVKLPQQDNGFIPPRAETGTSWVRIKGGMIHVVCSLDDSAHYTGETSDDFRGSLVRYDDDCTTVVMNLATFATSRYANWFFNSAARIGDEDYGVDREGMRLLDGTNDDGTEIVSAIDCGTIGLKSLQIKSPEYGYTTAISSAPVVMDIVLPNGDVKSFPAGGFGENVQETHRHSGMMGLMNRRMSWFRIVLRNNFGAMFDILTTTVLVNHSARKI